jgi:hypothetical protein
MDWSVLCEQFCDENGIGAITYMQAISKNDRRALLRIEKKRKDATRAMEAVKHAWQENPRASCEQMRRKAYKFVTGGVILTLLLQVLLSATMKLAIDYFLDKLFSEKADDETLPVSAE